MNPTKHHECYTRNKRDFVYQIYPRLNWDAVKDFQSAVKFYEKTFETQEENEPPPQQEAAEEKKEGEEGEEEAEDPDAEGEEEANGNGEGSFFGGKKPGGISNMNATMKRDRDNYRKKLQ